jgi:hypothetical protein
VSVEVQITSEQVQQIQPLIVEAVYGDNVMLNFAERNNLFYDIPRGPQSWKYFDWKEMETGKMMSGIQSMPVVHPVLGSRTVQLFFFGLKIEIDVLTVQNWQNAQNPRVGTTRDILAEAITKSMDPMNRSIDASIAYGDNSIFLADDDPMKGKGKFLGMFNSGVVFGAGGGDDGMGSFGDYIASCATATTNLKKQGFRKRQYAIMSDVNTHEDAQFGNGGVHLTAQGKNERDLVLERKDIAGWADSERAFPYVTAASTYPTVEESRILFTTPTTPKGDQAYRIIRSHNFDLLRANGGNYNDNFCYVIGVLWSGVFDPLIVDSNGKCRAIQVSGVLDYTA